MMTQAAPTAIVLALALTLWAAFAAAAAPGTPPLIEACRTGCGVAVLGCNGTDPAQLWRYSRGDPASIVLVAAQRNASYGLCVNVRDFGVGAGDEVWVTVCHTEHPLKANEGWLFNTSTAQLLNPRSHLCASAAAPASAAAAGAPAGVALGGCGKDLRGQQWRFDGQTGQIVVAGAWPGPERCLAVARPPPAPPPTPPPAPPGPALVNLNASTPAVFEVDERYVSFNLDGSYNRGWFQRDLANAKLRFLTAQLAPAVLRHGGSGNDYFDYAVPADSGLPTAPACRPGSAFPALPGTSHCPSWSDSKNCSVLAAQPGFCAAAAKGPQPNCCAQCHVDWNASSFPWPHGGLQGCSRFTHYGGQYQHTTPTPFD